MIGIVWFKRDLRLEDHAALHAAADGPVLPLYVVEPEYWRGADASWRQWAFTRGAVADLAARLPLVVRVGDAVAVLEALRERHGQVTLYSHEETGNLWTYARDRRVAAWARAQGVAWHEFPQHGVRRALRDRDRWSAFHARLMQAEPLPVPVLRFVDEACGTLPETPFPWADDGVIRPQPAGRAAALSLLAGFLAGRGADYRRGMSSPLTAGRVCSRLSPHLALGTLSMRQTLARAAAGGTIPATAIASFVSRLHWHCHFIQKLESEPAIEFENMHRGYDGLREDDFNAAHFAALTAGRTGWPLVDACVAMLRETGWLNFRMRAMLVSVAAYPLWLHWRPVGEWLATQFLDYEPGIHWSQLQMQSGTTGINTTRVYNPVKQALDHDPQGRFVRQWLPVLRRVPDSWLLEPWRMPASVQDACGVRIGEEWPQPLVELEAATRAAKQRLYERRGQASVRAAKTGIVQKHGSRRRPEGTASRAAPAAPDRQLSLDW